MPKGYWRDIENRKKFFCDLAKELGFDPSDAQNWASVSYHYVAMKPVSYTYTLTHLLFPLFQHLKRSNPIIGWW